MGCAGAAIGVPVLLLLLVSERMETLTFESRILSVNIWRAGTLVVTEKGATVARASSTAVLFFVAADCVSSGIVEPESSLSRVAASLESAEPL
jgi:hypothetical protein